MSTRLPRELPYVLVPCRSTIEEFNLSSRSITGILTAANPIYPRRCHFKIALDKASIEPELESIRVATTATEGIEGARPIQVLFALPSDRLLITEPVEGHGNVFNHLANTRSWWSIRRWHAGEMEAAGAKLGSWLAAYHLHTARPGTPQPELVNKLRDACDGRVRAVQRLAPGVIRASLATRIHRYCGEYAQLCQESPISISQIHGDLNLSNVLVEGKTGKLVIIDFGDSRDGIGLEDFANVLQIGTSLLRSRHNKLPREIPFVRGLLDCYKLHRSSEFLFRLLRTMIALRAIQSYYEFLKSKRFVGLLTAREYRRCALDSFQWLSCQPENDL